MEMDDWDWFDARFEMLRTELRLQTRSLVQAVIRASMAPPGTTQDMLHAEESILRSVYDPTPEGES